MSKPSHYVLEHKRRVVIVEDRTRDAEDANAAYCEATGRARLLGPDLGALTAFNHDGEPGQTNRYEADCVILTSRHGPPIDTARIVGVCVVIPFGSADTPEYRRFSVATGLRSFMLNLPPDSCWRGAAYGPECVALYRETRPARPAISLALFGEGRIPAVLPDGDVGSGPDGPGALEPWYWILRTIGPVVERIEVSRCGRWPFHPGDNKRDRLRIQTARIDDWAQALVRAGVLWQRRDETADGFWTGRPDADDTAPRVSTLARKREGASR